VGKNRAEKNAKRLAKKAAREKARKLRPERPDVPTPDICECGHWLTCHSGASDDPEDDTNGHCAHCDEDCDMMFGEIDEFLNGGPLQRCNEHKAGSP
jgi:hypothetical protein